MSLHHGISVPKRMSRDEFREFQFDRPDHERWELIDGDPVMMTPPLVDHNRITRNLERLLSDALEVHDPSRDAVQAVGIDLGLSKDDFAELKLGQQYAPEPDVLVIDAEPQEGLRIVQRAYLLAEVLSSTDDDLVNGRRWIDIKTGLYRAHASSEVVLAIRQDRVEVDLQVKEETGWMARVLTDMDAQIALPTFGLTCTVGDLYAGTHLNPRPTKGWKL